MLIISIDLLVRTFLQDPSGLTINLQGSEEIEWLEYRKKHG